MRRRGVIALVLVAMVHAAPVAQAQTQARPTLPAGVVTQRLLPLQGGRNFRDLGGYRTADGRHVR